MTIRSPKHPGAPIIHLFHLSISLITFTMSFSAKELNGTLQISISGEDPHNVQAYGFAYLHRMFWGQPRAETLARITEEWSVSIPQYDRLMGLSLDEPQAAKSMKEYKYRSIDISKSNIFPKLPSEWQDSELLASMLPCGRSQLVLLEDYQKLYNELLSLDQESKDISREARSHATIGAQPGIGKSVFLSYVLIIRLIEGKTTLFQVEGTGDYYPTLFLFDKEGVTVVPKNEIHRIDKFNFMRDKDVWILIDDMPLAPLYMPLRPRCFLLQAASPVKARFPGRKHLCMSTFYMDVWDWNEVVAGLWVANKPDPETNYWPLWCVYARYGGLPRLIYLTLKYRSKTPPTNLGVLVDDYDQDAKCLALNLKDHSPGDYFTSDTLPHDLIVTRPRLTSKLNDPPPFSSSKRKIARTSQSGIRTAYIMEMVFEVFAKSFQNKALAIYKYLGAQVDAKTFEGHLFEKHVHKLFGAGYPPTKALRLLTDGQQLITFPGTKRGLVEFESGADVGRLLRKKPGQTLANDELSGLYLKPTKRNFAAIDSMTFHKVDGSYEIYFFQITISKEHPIKIKPTGLKEFYDNFPHGLKGAGVTIYFVFVVPDEIAVTFHKQGLLDNGKQYDLETSEPWIKGMKQVVIGLTAGELFGVETEADCGDKLSPRQHKNSLVEAVESSPTRKRRVVE